MSTTPEAILISRVVDGDAEVRDWDALDELARHDEGLYRRLADALGLDVRPADDVLSAQLGVDADRVLAIENVVEGKAAEKAGVRRFDVVTHIQGHAPATREVLRNELVQLTPGENLELRVLRRSEPMVLEVRPQEAPPVDGRFELDVRTSVVNDVIRLKGRVAEDPEANQFVVVSPSFVGEVLDLEGNVASGAPTTRHPWCRARGGL